MSNFDHLDDDELLGEHTEVLDETKDLWNQLTAINKDDIIIEFVRRDYFKSRDKLQALKDEIESRGIKNGTAI